MKPIEWVNQLVQRHGLERPDGRPLYQYRVTDGEYIERELALIKVSTDADSRAEALRIVDIFRAKVIDVTPKSYTIEITGAPAKINGILELLRPMGIKEVVRSGPVVIGRGAKGVVG